jgi:hypothetical protein
MSSLDAAIQAEERKTILLAKIKRVLLATVPLTIMIPVYFIGYLVGLVCRGLYIGYITAFNWEF